MTFVQHSGLLVAITVIFTPLVGFAALMAGQDSLSPVSQLTHVHSSHLSVLTATLVILSKSYHLKRGGGAERRVLQSDVTVWAISVTVWTRNKSDPNYK